jgi:hypothetical protein
VRRAAGPLTPLDIATVSAFREALRSMMAPQLAALEGIARSHALAAAFDRQPRHRELPARADVMHWLDRHTPAGGASVDRPHRRRWQDGYQHPAPYVRQPVDWQITGGV